MAGELNLADIAAVTRNNDNDGWGGNGGWLWIIVLFIFAGGWGRGFGGNGGDGAVTEAGLCNAMNFNDMQNSIGRGFDAQTAYAMQNMRDNCTAFSNISAQLDQVRFDNQQCCCETQRMIDGVNYNNAMNTASINQTTDAAAQRILDKMCAIENAAKDARIQQLELNQALAGVVRYPNGITYNAGCSPFFNGSCCGTSF